LEGLRSPWLLPARWRKSDAFAKLHQRSAQACGDAGHPPDVLEEVASLHELHGEVCLARGRRELVEGDEIGVHHARQRAELLLEVEQGLGRRALQGFERDADAAAAIEHAVDDSEAALPEPLLDDEPVGAGELLGEAVAGERIERALVGGGGGEGAGAGAVFGSSRPVPGALRKICVIHGARSTLSVSVCRCQMPGAAVPRAGAEKRKLTSTAPPGGTITRWRRVPRRSCQASRV
jgi:hypothetical protein